MDNNYLDNILDFLVSESKNENNPILTGEKNLKITKSGLIDRILANKRGEGYIDVLECENSILERQGLIRGYFEDGDVYFDIPNYDRFISAVNAFYVSYQDEEGEE